jgi:hypothetical protein
MSPRIEPISTGQTMPLGVVTEVGACTQCEERREIVRVRLEVAAVIQKAFPGALEGNLYKRCCAECLADFAAAGPLVRVFVEARDDAGMVRYRQVVSRAELPPL